MSDRPVMISIRNTSKHFGAVTAVQDVSLDIKEGEFFALLGPSGCGKTTLLRMIAGFETPSEGALLVDQQDMAGIQPNHRPVNMVFQSYAVFPHMTVTENVAYGLKVTGVAKAERLRRAREALALVRLEGLGDRKPDQLSGGQRQRVALARALIKRPKVLLLDEPLSALDAKLREAMQLELVRLQKSVGITFVIVTHDQVEALSMADRIAVMDHGRVMQVAPPAELYEFPRNRIVAEFIGRMNSFSGSVAGLENGTISLDVEGLGRINVPFEGEAQGTVSVAIRPEKTRLSQEQPDGDVISVQGMVTELGYHGNESHVYLETFTGLKLNTVARSEARSTKPVAEVGERLWVSWSPGDTLILTE